jgi:hypothetical protein
MLLTTRLAASLKQKSDQPAAWEGPPDPGRSKAASKGFLKRAWTSLRSILRLVNRVGEECYRQCLTWYYLWQGNIVLYDRHFFFDYYAYDIAPILENRSLSRRMHGLFLQYILPKPDLVIYLDAPAAVLFARKGEGTIESLERRRQEYLQARRHVRHFEVIDATQPMEQVTREVTQVILAYSESRSKKQAERSKQTL